MFILEINDGETVFKCSYYSYGFNGERGNIAVSIKGLPTILKNAHLASMIIRKLIVYEERLPEYKKYAPVFLNVKINEIIDSDDGSFSTISMDSSGYTVVSSNTVKFCLDPDCNYRIDYTLVMMALLRMSIDEKTAEKIWESSHTNFFCCTHFYLLHEPNTVF